MPQAMPLNWLSLFIFFSVTFMLINIKMYFINSPDTKTLNLNVKKTNYWKW